jgi:hypothetical protein
MTSKDSAAKSALVILAPEAEPLVGSFREKYDPSAAAGMPAHITLFYPFLPPEEIAEPVIAILRRCFAGFAPYRYCLVSVRHYGRDSVYLAPDPAEPFRQITLAIWRDFPDRPPYGGKHTDIVAHLSVAQTAGKTVHADLASRFESAARRNLPIAATAQQVALMDNVTGRWRVRRLFRLGAG